VISEEAISGLRLMIMTVSGLGCVATVVTIH